ncbi:T9SS type A sorting domain-containing protein [Flavobacterium fluviatile]|uniref:T9SS type A sorting domain-containing protein n=1 Tax=Flavobacterium fluviatile TaxID=1862387 RepID=UPI0013D3FB7D|nr:T9SS type A sorting domain-containing protein [Flavobacterium fluviatile]
MKKNTIKSFLFASFLLLSFSLIAQTTAPDEDTGSYTTCNPDGENAVRETDIPNPVNTGTIDDRSCYANYKESTVYGKTWGVYNITAGSNKFDTSLQPRIERSLSRSQQTGVGSYAKFTGTVRILEVGDTSGTSNDGTYIAQAKGKHTGGGGSADPAICLYLAMPVYGTGADAGKQVSFDIYAERILVRGGEGSSGREIVFLKNISKNVETTFELEVGFRQDPNDATKKIQYCDVVIGGEVFKWNIPSPERGTESGIRYGAYRVKGGRAQIRWANTTYQKAEVVDTNPPPATGDVYRLKNVATGKFLTDSGVSATPVTMSDSGVEDNKQWTFVDSGSFYNLDSKTYGVLRATGAGFAAGAYAVVITGTNPPSSDGDKVWTIHYDESDDTYRFESGTSGRFLYHDANGNVTHVIVPDTDTRSKWKAIPISTSLGVEDFSKSNSLIRLYPNPAKHEFTLEFKELGIVSVNIYDVLGRLLYSKTINENNHVVTNNGLLKSGVYLVKVNASNNNSYFTKLIIE